MPGMGLRGSARFRRAACMFAIAALSLGLLAAVPAAASAAAADSPPTLQQAFDNVGITTKADATTGNYDGIGDSFSAAGLAEDALSPGNSLLHDGLTITWPDVAPG